MAPQFQGVGEGLWAPPHSSIPSGDGTLKLSPHHRASHWCCLHFISPQSTTRALSGKTTHTHLTRRAAIWRNSIVRASKQKNGISFLWYVQGLPNRASQSCNQLLPISASLGPGPKKRACCRVARLCSALPHLYQKETLKFPPFSLRSHLRRRGRSSFFVGFFVCVLLFFF